MAIPVRAMAGSGSCGVVKGATHLSEHRQAEGITKEIVARLRPTWAESPRQCREAQESRPVARATRYRNACLAYCPCPEAESSKDFALRSSADTLFSPGVISVGI
jgi:hypothetical protein